MKTVTVERPEWIPEGAWELEGFTFDIEDTLPAAVREKISRRANAIAIKAARLLALDQSIYEDDGVLALLSDQYAACRQAVVGIYRDGQELTPSERTEVLDQMNIVSRDCLANEVAGINQLGLKKK